MIAVGAIAALILGGDRGAPPGAAPDPALAAPLALAPIRDDSPMTIQAMPPAGLSGKSEKEWRKVVDKLRERAWGEALDKLARFEDRFGASPETQSLRDQIEAVRARDPAPADEGERGPPGRGRGKHDD